MVERGLEAERADRRPEAPAEVRQPLDEVGRQPEIVGAQLAIVFALAERRVCKSLAVGVDELVSPQLVVELEGVEQDMRVLDP